MYEYIAGQLRDIKEQIALAADEAGRAPGEVKLVAVSKTFSPEAILAAYEQGQRVFGENRVQELEMKAGILPGDIEWHLIGSLQSNKAAKAINAACIHSVDSVKLIKRLDRLAEENHTHPEILLEINISGEASKAGADSESEAMEMAESAVSCRKLKFAGLMTMAPFNAKEDELHKIFAGLRGLRDKMELRFGLRLPELSMGMSSDYRIAIAEGATLVRIGTAIFGGRNYL